MRKVYLDQDNALIEVKMPLKMNKKGRLRGPGTTVIRLSQVEKERGVISKPKPFSKLSPL